LGFNYLIQGNLRRTHSIPIH